jgi:hypothetical protein
MDPKAMKIISPKKHLVKEVWARSKFSLESENGEEGHTRKVLIGYFPHDLQISKLVLFLKEKGLYFSLGSSYDEPRFYAYDHYMDMGVVFDTFEECENFLRSGVSYNLLVEMAMMVPSGDSLI